MTTDTSALDLSALPLDKVYINGEWADAADDARIEIVSPDTEATVASVARASRDEVDRATAAARAAFDSGPWPRLSMGERIDYLRRFSNAIQARSEEISLAWSLQVDFSTSWTTRGERP